VEQEAVTVDSSFMKVFLLFHGIIVMEMLLNQPTGKSSKTAPRPSNTSPEL